MLHISVIAVGKLKEKFWSQACDEYLKRLRPYASVEVVELPDVDPAKVGGEQKAVEAESRSIIDVIPRDALSILLDIEAKLVSSEQMAEALDGAALDGKNDIAFIIGGSCGVSKEVREAVTLRWSFGRITLPHNLARVVLLEQIYRTFRIIRHEPYHK